MSQSKKARLLQEEQSARREPELKAFERHAKMCLAHVETINRQTCQTYTVYEIPYRTADDPPQMDAKKCIEHVRDRLRGEGFMVKICKDMKTLFISWDELHTRGDSPTKRGRNHRQAKRRKARGKRSTDRGGDDSSDAEVIYYNPSDPLSRLNLKAKLMTRS
jgi:hypothetical protein